MTTPFEAFKRHFSVDEGTTHSTTSIQRIVLPCKTCQRDISRTDLPSAQWVHVDDEMRITPNTAGVIISTYDHPAEPDVLDCEGWDA